MKIKTKDNFNVSLNNANNTPGKKLKGNRKSKCSPEENLGLKLEKLIEKGVKVRKIDSLTPEKKNYNSQGKKNVSTPNSPFKVTTASTEHNLKSPVMNNRSPGIVGGKKSSPNLKLEKFQSPVANGKSKPKKPMENTESLNRLKLEKVMTAVQACLKNAEARDKKKKLIDEPEPLYMQITVVKKLVTPDRTARFNLKHKLITEDSEVCFIAGNRKCRDIDRLVNDYKDLFQKLGFSNIKQVIPFSQLTKEYKQYELRRKLCGAYDFFIADERISKSLLNHLGKPFIAARKIPVYVDMQKNVKENIEKAFQKTAMKISQNQDMFCCVVGKRNFPAKHIAENICNVADALETNLFPGGWKNVRSIFIRSRVNTRFPIYYSKVSPNSIEEPVVQPRRPKAAAPVVGELSTANNAIVKVEAGGRVTVLKNNNTDSDDDEEEEEEDDDTSDFDISDDESDAHIYKRSPSSLVKNMKQSLAKVNQNDDDDDDDDDEDDDSDDDDSSDDVGAKAEQDYLREIMSAEEDDDEDDDSEQEEEVKKLPQQKRKLIQAENYKIGNKCINKQQDNDDDESDEEDSDEDDRNSDSDESVAGLTPNSKKRKSENNKEASSPVKKSKPDNVVIKSQGKFDTTLGESWAIKKKQVGQASTKQQKLKQGRNMNKKSNNNFKRAQKLNKHQRKANIKKNKAKKR